MTSWCPLGASIPCSKAVPSPPPLRTHARRPTAALLAIGALLALLGIGAFVLDWALQESTPPTASADE